MHCFFQLLDWIQWIRISRWAPAALPADRRTPSLVSAALIYEAGDSWQSSFSLRLHRQPKRRLYWAIGQWIVLSGHDRWQPKFIWQTEALNKLKAHFQLAVVRSQYGMHCILCSAYITTHFKFGGPNTDQSPHRIWSGVLERPYFFASIAC